MENVRPIKPRFSAVRMCKTCACMYRQKKGCGVMISRMRSKPKTKVSKFTSLCQLKNTKMTLFHSVCNFASRYYEILALNKQKAILDAKSITCTYIYGYYFSQCHDNYAKSIHLFPNFYISIKSCVKPKSRKMQDMDEDAII